MMRIKKPNMTLNHQQKNILKSNVLSHKNFGGVSKSMLTLNEAIIDVKKG